MGSRRGKLDPGQAGPCANRSCDELSRRCRNDGALPGRQTGYRIAQLHGAQTIELGQAGQTTKRLGIAGSATVQRGEKVTLGLTIFREGAIRMGKFQFGYGHVFLIFVPSGKRARGFALGLSQQSLAFVEFLSQAIAHPCFRKSATFLAQFALARNGTR